MKNIQYGRHSISKEDLKAVNLSLRSEYLTNGISNKIFRKKLSNFLKNKKIVLTSSGTAGLDLAFKSLNLKEEDVIIMPAINFIAAYNAAINNKLKVFLCDVDPITGQSTPELVEKCIKKNKIKDLKCILTMFLGGSPENAFNFYKLKKKYKCFLIEDACHAFGSYFLINKKKIFIGSNKYSDVSVFSFHPVKAIATGEGGCLTLKDSKIFLRALKLSNHGILRSKNHWDYDIIENGLNYRISDINCALGSSQIERIKKFLTKRNLIAEKYVKKLKVLNDVITIPKYSSNVYNSYHLFLIHINFKRLKKDKNNFFKFMLKNKITLQYHYKPIYSFNIYKNKLRNFENSEKYYSSAVSLPIFYDLRNYEQNYIIKKLLEFISCNIINK